MNCSRPSSECRRMSKGVFIYLKWNEAPKNARPWKGLVAFFESRAGFRLRTLPTGTFIDLENDFPKTIRNVDLRNHINNIQRRFCTRRKCVTEYAHENSSRKLGLKFRAAVGICFFNLSDQNRSQLSKQPFGNRAIPLRILTNRDNAATSATRFSGTVLLEYAVETVRKGSTGQHAATGDNITVDFMPRDRSIQSLNRQFHSQMAYRTIEKLCLSQNNLAVPFLHTPLWIGKNSGKGGAREVWAL